jgi:hypothetical protein
VPDARAIEVSYMDIAVDNTVVSRLDEDGALLTAVEAKLAATGVRLVVSYPVLYETLATSNFARAAGRARISRARSVWVRNAERGVRRRLTRMANIASIMRGTSMVRQCRLHPSICGHHRRQIGSPDDLLAGHSGERVAKYNQLLRIEEELGAKAKYAGAVVYGR